MSAYTVSRLALEAGVSVHNRRHRQGQNLADDDDPG